MDDRGTTSGRGRGAARRVAGSSAWAVGFWLLITTLLSAHVLAAPDAPDAVEATPPAAAASAQKSSAASFLKPPRRVTAPQPPAPQHTNPDNSAEALYERAFGQSPQPRARWVPSPLLIDGREVGQIAVQPLSGDLAQLQGAPLLTALEGTLLPQYLEVLGAAVDEQGQLPISALRRIGIQASYDAARLLVRVDVPPSMRRPTVTSLQRAEQVDARDAIVPADVSGYVNVRASGQAAGSDSLELLPPRLGLDGALNIRQWVLEGSATASPGLGDGWSLGDLRVVHDDPRRMVRYMAGDIATPYGAFQDAIAMGGVSATRNFSLQPYLVTRPLGQYDFYLERPSWVEVLVNGRSVKTLQLPAGRQDIRDLALATGVNDIRLLITDDLGRKQELRFQAGLSDALLAKGLNQFSYAVGFPMTSDGLTRSYDLELPTLSLLHRRGLTDRVTLGGYAHGNRKQQLVGAGHLLGSPLGNVGLDLAASHLAGEGTGGAVRLQYEYSRSQVAQPFQLGLSFDLRGPAFARLGEPPGDELRYLASGWAGRNFGRWLGASLRADYEAETSERGERLVLSLGFSSFFRNGLRASLDLGDLWTRDEGHALKGMLSLSWTLPGRRQSLRATTESRELERPENTLAWNYLGRGGMSGFSASVAVREGATDEVSDQVRWQGHRGGLDLAHSSSWSPDASRHSGQLSAGTALVFAGPHVAWSRPINGSFVIIGRESSLESLPIGIGGSAAEWEEETSHLARADRFGAAVWPDLQPYRVTRMAVDLSSLPEGYSLERDNLPIVPAYKSGAMVELKARGTVVLKGMVLSSSGHPIGLMAGRIESISQPGREPVEMFTNHAGKFVAPGLDPGVYELILVDGTLMPFRFEIPKGSGGTVDVGDLMVQERPAEVASSPDACPGAGPHFGLPGRHGSRR